MACGAGPSPAMPALLLSITFSKQPVHPLSIAAKPQEDTQSGGFQAGKTEGNEREEIRMGRVAVTNLPGNL
jgi:hypothetical protein